MEHKVFGMEHQDEEIEGEEAYTKAVQLATAIRQGGESTQQEVARPAAGGLIPDGGDLLPGHGVQGPGGGGHESQEEGRAESHGCEYGQTAGTRSHAPGPGRGEAGRSEEGSGSLTNVLRLGPRP